MQARTARGDESRTHECAGYEWPLCRECWLPQPAVICKQFGILAEMHRVRQKAWELLGKMEAEGDHRGSVVALRKVRECMESLGEMLARAEALKNAGPSEL